MTEKLTKAFEYVDSKGWKRSGVWSIVGRDAFLAGHASRDEEVKALKDKLKHHHDLLLSLHTSMSGSGFNKEAAQQLLRDEMVGLLPISETEEEPTDLNP